MKKMLLLAVALFAIGVSAADYVFVCKEMTYTADPKTGWSCSTTGVLVANAKGLDITGTYQIPAAGKYNVWVLTETRNEGWRKGKLFINDAPFGTFGDDKLKDFTKPCGYWKKSMMPLEIKAANEIVKLKITSLNSMVRVQKVLFTDNATFDPNTAALPATAVTLESGE